MKAVGVFPGSQEVKIVEQEVPRLSEPDHVMLRMGTVNAGSEAFASALRNLDVFRQRWPAVVPTLIAGRYPPEQAPDLILGRPTGIKSVIAFDVLP